MVAALAARRHPFLAFGVVALYLHLDAPVALEGRLGLERRALEPGAAPAPPRG